MTQTPNRLLAALQVSEKQTNETAKAKPAQKPAFFENIPKSQSQDKPASASTSNKTQLTPAYLQSVGKLKSTPKSTSQSTKNISLVDISVAGTTHRIGCANDKVANLRQNTETLNQKLKSLRLQVSGKPPTNEELLVLHCLALYDEVAALKSTQEQTRTLVDKLLSQVKQL